MSQDNISRDNIINAWKDENFRNSLSEEERALLPEHPAGSSELTDAELSNVAGGLMMTYTLTGCPDLLFTLLC